MEHALAEAKDRAARRGMNPYSNRRQRVPDLGAEIFSNIAEYAVMLGIPFDLALQVAQKQYGRMVIAIHADKGRVRPC